MIQDDPHSKQYLFAPKEIVIETFLGKNDDHGLGYDPIKNAPEFHAYGKGSDFLHKEDSEIKSRGVGFGVGIFEDEDEDVYYGGKDDIYSKSLMNEDEEIMERKDTDKVAAMQLKESSLDKTVPLGFDGRPALNGFKFSVHVLKQFKKIAPIKIEAGWKPKTPFENDKKNSSTIPPGKLSVDQRRTILGEEALKGPTPKPTSSSVQLFSSEDLNFSALPTVDKACAMMALNGFKPFGDDLQKQLRYVRYLEVKADIQKEFMQPPTVYIKFKLMILYLEYAGTNAIS